MKSKLVPKEDSPYTNTNEMLSKDSNFRARIEDKLMDLMNHRKELIVTHVRNKRDSSASLHFSATKDKNVLRYQKKMPDYVQNM